MCPYSASVTPIDCEHPLDLGETLPLVLGLLGAQVLE
jgi:hypothetical protein